MSNVMNRFLDIAYERKKRVVCTKKEHVYTYSAVAGEYITVAKRSSEGLRSRSPRITRVHLILSFYSFAKIKKFLLVALRLEMSEKSEEKCTKIDIAEKNSSASMMQAFNGASRWI